MKTAALTTVALVGLLGVASSLAKTSTPQPSVSRTVPPISTAGPNAEVEALRAQTAEMRRSEDRLLSTVHWALALVAGAALLNWWIGRSFYKRDLANTKAEVLDELGARLTKVDVPRIRGELIDFDANRLAVLEASLNALILNRIAQVYADGGLTVHAIHASLEELGLALAAKRNPARASGLADFSIHALRRLTALVDGPDRGRIEVSLVDTITQQVADPLLAGVHEAAALLRSLETLRTRKPPP